MKLTAYERFDNNDRFDVSAVEEINKLNWIFRSGVRALLCCFGISGYNTESISENEILHFAKQII